MTKSFVGSTPAWISFSWICFFISLASMAAAVFYLPMDGWLRGYLALSSLFIVQSSISLSKTLRDQAEAEAAKG